MFVRETVVEFANQEVLVLLEILLAVHALLDFINHQSMHLLVYHVPLDFSLLETVLLNAAIV
jgi:hypothetical protein